MKLSTQDGNYSGHILRQHPDTITNVVMKKYFENPHPMHNLSGTQPIYESPSPTPSRPGSNQATSQSKNSKDLKHLNTLAQKKIRGKNSQIW